MSKIQFNAKSFSATRKILNAYYGAKFEMAMTLKKCKDNADRWEKAVTADRATLAKIVMGEKTNDIRTAEKIREDIATNKKYVDEYMSEYNTLKDKVDDALSDAVDLFSDEKSVLYKAYKAYAESLTDETYTAYATAMAERFVALGLTDATVENVTPFMVNADRELRGKSAINNSDIRIALKGKAFSEALLGKIYVANKSAFASKKFVDYCKRIADAKKANK